MLQGVHTFHGKIHGFRLRLATAAASIVSSGGYHGSRGFCSTNWQQRLLLYELLQTLQNYRKSLKNPTWININQHEWWSIDGIDSKPSFTQRGVLYKNCVIHKHHVLHKNHVLAGPALSMVARGTCRRRLNNCWILFVYVAYNIRRRIWWSPSHLTLQNPKLAAHV